MEKKDFPTAYQSMIYKTRYSRWLPDQNRREEWPETVGRYVDFMFDHVNNEHGFEDENLKQEVYEAILNLEVMPSMRALMTAGPALSRSHIAAYNCAFLAVDTIKAFDEALYVLMNGTGVGFSVERKYTDQLPVVPDEFVRSEDKYLVEDSKEGWAFAVNHVVTALYNGIIPDWDLSLIRPEGSILKVFGGRASGPEPLDSLLNFIVKTVVEAGGRKLTPLECHELMCKIGEVVVVGGVRRAALISLSNLDETDIRDAKSGSWWEDKPHLSLSNNSVAYQSRPDRETFDAEWAALESSGSGERGIINMDAARKKAAKSFRDPSKIAGFNPCAEILLRNKQFCNLSSVTVSSSDNEEDLLRKIRIAAVIGTLQSTLTDFPYLSPEWKQNCEEERLLGVSLNGIFSNPLMYERGRELEQRLERFKNFAVAVNRQYAHRLGINPSKSVTTVKPEGTTSQLVNTSSGIHPWYDNYYLRRVRGDNKDPVTEFLKFYGVHAEQDVMQSGTDVFTFPIEAPADAKTRNELTAIEHLEVWKTYSQHWTQHNPSVTVNIKDDEWGRVGDWVYENFDLLTGVSFLPWSGGSYQQAPYESIDVEKYNNVLEKTPEELPWDTLSYFEESDSTSSSQELACVAGGCSLEKI